MFFEKILFILSICSLSIYLDSLNHRVFLILSCHQRSHHYLQSFLLEIVIRAVCYSIARALCKKIVYIGPLLVYLDTVHVAMAIFHNSLSYCTYVHVPRYYAPLRGLQLGHKA